MILDTALQASNLVTAISALYASLSGLPFGIGVALATALSAVLIGTFIASKSSAASAAGFAEGGEYQYGYTWDGTKYQKSNTLGKKPYNYHKKEFILDAETTTDLGLNGMSMSDARTQLLGNMPSSTTARKKNKAINRQMTKNTVSKRERQQTMYNTALLTAISKQNKTLEQIRDKPIAIALGGGRTMIRHKNGSYEIVKGKVIKGK